MKGLKKHIALAAVFAALFAVVLLLVCTADVAAIGPEGTSVGLSHLNAAMAQAIGFHSGFFGFSEWLGNLAIVVVFAFACVGLVQLVRRKRLRKVDREILALGALYVAIGLLYVLFEKAVVNYRPVILPGETGPEASFPSSHTMLACVVFGSAALLSTRYGKDAVTRKLLALLCWLLASATVILRLLSGAHWATDIAAGVLLSAALLEAYAAAIAKDGRTSAGEAS